MWLWQHVMEWRVCCMHSMQHTFEYDGILRFQQAHLHVTVQQCKI